MHSKTILPPQHQQKNEELDTGHKSSLSPLSNHPLVSAFPLSSPAKSGNSSVETAVQELDNSDKEALPADKRKARHSEGLNCAARVSSSNCRELRGETGLASDTNGQDSHQSHLNGRRSDSEDNKLARKPWEPAERYKRTNSDCPDYGVPDASAVPVPSPRRGGDDMVKPDGPNFGQKRHAISQIEGRPNTLYSDYNAQRGKTFNFSKQRDDHDLYEKRSYDDVMGPVLTRPSDIPASKRQRIEKSPVKRGSVESIDRLSSKGGPTSTLRGRRNGVNALGNSQVSEYRNVDQMMNGGSGRRHGRGSLLSQNHQPGLVFVPALTQPVEEISDNEDELQKQQPMKPDRQKPGTLLTTLEGNKKTYAASARDGPTGSGYFANSTAPVQRGNGTAKGPNRSQGSTFSASAPIASKRKMIHQLQLQEDDLSIDELEQAQPEMATKAERRHRSTDSTARPVTPATIGKTGMKNASSDVSQSQKPDSGVPVSCIASAHAEWVDNDNEHGLPNLQLVWTKNVLYPMFGPRHADKEYPSFIINPSDINRVKYVEGQDGRLIINRKQLHNSTPVLLVDLASPHSSAKLVADFINHGGHFSAQVLAHDKMSKAFNFLKLQCKRRGSISQIVPDDIRLLNAKHERRVDGDEITAQSSSDVKRLRISRRMELDDPIHEQREKEFEHRTTSIEPSRGVQETKSFKQPRVMQITSERQTRSRASRESILDLSEFETPKWTDMNPGWQEQWQTGDLLYPARGKDRANVAMNDIYKLDDGEWLNDNLIHFFLRYLECSLGSQDPELAKRVYFMNTFFYKNLSEGTKSRNINYEKVRRWVKVNIFEYDYIIVPICQGLHWFLAVICNPGKLLQKPEEGAAAKDSAGLLPQDEQAPGVQHEDSVIITGESKQADTSDTSDAGKIGVGVKKLSIDDEDAHGLGGEDNRVSSETGRKGKHESVEDQTGHESKDSPEAGATEISTTSKLGKTKLKRRKSTPRKYPPDQPRIVIMDSFGGSQYGVTSNLRDYLVQEAKEKYGHVVQQTSIGMTAKNLPQQHNGCDCGLFLLGYVQSFLRNPDALMHGLMQKMDAEQLQPFFVDMDASKLRDQIRRLLFKLAREQAVREHNEKIAKRTAKQAAKLANNRQTAPPSSSPIQMSSQPQLSQGPPEQAANQVQKVPVISESSPYTVPKVNTGTEAVVADAEGPTPEEVGLDANANQRGSPILGDDVNDTEVTAQSPAAVATKPVVSDRVVENKAQWIASENLEKHHASLSHPELMPAIEDLVEDMLFEDQRPEGAAEVVVQSTLSSAILPEKRKEKPVESRRLGSPFKASPARKTHVEVVVETPVKKPAQGPAPRQTAHDNDIQEAALPSRALESAKTRRENPYHVQAPASQSTIDEDEVKEVQPPSNTVSAIKTRNVTPYHGGVQKRTTVSVDDADRRPDHDSIALALEKKHTAVLVVDEVYERLSQDSLVQAMPQEHRPRNTQRTEIPDSQEHEVHPDDRQERQPSFTSLLSDDEDEPVPVDAPVEPIKHSFMGSGTRRNKTGAAAASSSRVATTIGGGTHMHFSSPTRTSPRALSRKSVVSSQQTRVSPPSPRSGRDSPARSRVTSPRMATRSSPRQPGRSSMTVAHRSDGKKSGGSDKESAIELD